MTCELLQETTLQTFYLEDMKAEGQRTDPVFINHLFLSTLINKEQKFWYFEAFWGLFAIHCLLTQHIR